MEDLYGKLHIKLKIFERAFQRRIIREIPTSNEEDMTFQKSVRAEICTGVVAPKTRRRGAHSREKLPNKAQMCEKAPNNSNLT